MNDEEPTSRADQIGTIVAWFIAIALIIYLRPIFVPWFESLFN